MPWARCRTAWPPMRGRARRRDLPGLFRLHAANVGLAAMMNLPVPFVFSHDSIGIGRNGPTHQPVEYLAALRAIPNMLVLRPADAVEAAECWEIALDHRTRPSSLIFARQLLMPCVLVAGGKHVASWGLCAGGG